MPFYNIKIISSGNVLSTPASNSAEALDIFGKEIGVSLTLGGDGLAHPYLLDARRFDIGREHRQRGVNMGERRSLTLGATVQVAQNSSGFSALAAEGGYDG